MVPVNTTRLGVDRLKKLNKYQNNPTKVAIRIQTINRHTKVQGCIISRKPVKSYNLKHHKLNDANTIVVRHTIDFVKTIVNYLLENGVSIKIRCNFSFMIFPLKWIIINELQ